VLVNASCQCRVLMSVLGCWFVCSWSLSSCYRKDIAGNAWNCYW